MRWRIPLLTLGALLIAFFFVRIGGRFFSAQVLESPISVRPVVLYQETVDYQRDPRGRVEVRHEIDVRPDGTLVEGSTVPGFLDRPGLMLRTVQYADGRVEALVPHTRLRVPLPSQAQNASARRSAIKGTASCQSRPFTVLGTERILEWDAEILVFERRNRSTGELEMRRTYWRAPSLGCAMVKARFESGNGSGGEKVIAEILTVRTENAVRDEVLGPSYTASAPSQAYRAVTDATGKTPDLAKEKQLDDALTQR